MAAATPEEDAVMMFQLFFIFILAVQNAHPPGVQSFCLQEAANQHKASLKGKELKQLVSDSV